MWYPIKGITVCVGYDDLLAVTLPRNVRHMTDVVVVTHPDDVKTQAVVASVPSARCFLTDAFYRHGATFNKGLAMEEGFDEVGRDGWLLVWDADTLFPDAMTLGAIYKGLLYGARRRLLEDPTPEKLEQPWTRYPLSREQCLAGYFQLFHGHDHHVRSLPWYDVTFAHAGGCDGYFQTKWPQGYKVWLPFEVLHLGPRDANWFGRATPRMDGEIVEGADLAAELMESYVAGKNWRKPRIGDATRKVDEHVAVPGYSRTGYYIKGRGE